MWVDRYQFPAGTLYYMRDEDVLLPGEERVIHVTRRPVLVVSDQNQVHGNNAAPDWPSVLVVPVSHSTSYKTRFCVKISMGDGNLPKKGWARVPALQLVDKSRLDEWIGQVAPETLDAVTAQILSYLGLIQPSPPTVDDSDDRQLDDIPF